MNSTDDEEIEGIDCSPCCRSERLKFIVVSLLLGQILSLCLCGTGVSSQFLASKYNVETPTIFRKRWWKYAILAFIDVQANFLVVKAYQYTNLASIQVLDCFTIPVVLVLSFIFLYVRYLLSHILGVAICLIGIGCLVWGDVVNGKGVGGSDKLLGDIFCLSGAALYGVSNVAEEKLLKRFSRTEYLGMVGIFGSVISGIQLALIERENLAQVPWHHYEIIILYLAFALCMFTFYSLVTVVIQKTSAAMYNLNILTADFYTLLAGLVIFEYTVSFILRIRSLSAVHGLKPV
uniref:Solute carrier family 35 member F1 n=1 Tax=Romanomermis culicivorax TaxID=13658 RepID=A0A915JPM1_ROMCU